MLSQARQASGRKSSAFTPFLDTIFRASVGQTWAHTPAALTGGGIGIEVQGEALPGDALGGLLELLEVAARLLRMGRSVIVEIKAESGQEAVHRPQAMHLEAS